MRYYPLRIVRISHTGGTTRRTWSIWIIAAVLVLLAGCGERRIKTTPEELLGVWKTTAQSYADRFMEFRLEQIVFGTGGQTSVTYDLAGLARNVEADHTDYTVYYENEDGLEYSMDITYYPQDGGIIRFVNQNLTWRKSAR